MADFIDTDTTEPVQDDGVNTGRFEGEEVLDSDVEEMLESYSRFKQRQAREHRQETEDDG